MKEKNNLIKDLKKEINLAKKAKLKMIPFPKYIYNLLGKSHRKKGIIVFDETNNNVLSPFIDRKKNDYILYTAKIYEKLDSSLYSIRKDILYLLNQYDVVLNEYKQLKRTDLGDDIHSIDYKRKERQLMSDMNDKKKNMEYIKNSVDQYLEMIKHLELLVQEEIIQSHYQLHSILSRYIQGALTKADNVNYIPDICFETDAYQKYKDKNQALDLRMNQLLNKGEFIDEKE